MIKRISNWHQTKPGLLVFALVELTLAYAFVSLSIDHGVLWYYLLTLIFLVGSLQNLFKLTDKLLRGRHGKRKTS